MSDRAAGWWFLFLLSAAPAELEAQPATVWQDSAGRLRARLEALRDSMFQGDSTVEEIERRGDLTLGASPGSRAAAGPALSRLVAARERWFGGASPSPDGFRIVLRSAPSEDRTYTIVVAGLPDTGRAPRSERPVLRSRQLAESLIDLYGEMMYQSAGPGLLKWLDLPLPLSLPDQERRYLAMYAVVTGTGRAQRGCVAGRLGDCAYVLGLRPPASAARTSNPVQAIAAAAISDLRGPWAGRRASRPSRHRASRESAGRSAAASSAASIGPGAEPVRRCQASRPPSSRAVSKKSVRTRDP